MNWAPLLYFAQMVVAIILVAAILLQVRTQELGGVFGQQATVFRARRGLEKTLFQATIVLAVVFVLLSVISAAL